MKLPKKLGIYILFVCIFAVGIFYYLAINVGMESNYKEVIFWSIMVIVAESLLVDLPNKAVGVSVGSAVSIAAIIIRGPFFATLISGIGFLFRMPYISGKGRKNLFNTPLYKTFFNIAQAIIINGLAGMFYISLTDKQITTYTLFVILLTILCYEILNAIIMSGLLKFIEEQKFIMAFIRNVIELFKSSFAICLIGVIIALAYINYSYWAVVLFFVPLLLARYTFKLYIDMRNVYIETIHALNKALECKDPYTSGHAKRVEEYATKLAKEIGMNEKQIEKVSTAALMHDIGKIGIPDGILNKTSRLSPIEYEQVQLHPVIGANILMNVDFLKDIAEIIRYHHERYDGRGYPNHLKNEDIPLESSILSIADVYDAMTSDRPYRKALSKGEAIEELKANKGTQFTPELVEKFIDIMSA